MTNKTNLMLLLASASLASGACMSLNDMDHGQWFRCPDIAVDSNGYVNKLQVFDTNRTGTEDPDLEVGIGNILIIAESRHRVDDESRGGTVTVSMDDPANSLTITLVDLDEPATLIFYHEGRPPTLTSWVHTGDGDYVTKTYNIEHESFDLVFSGSAGFRIEQVGETTQIPEPTTGTLALLPAFMLARRKR